MVEVPEAAAAIGAMLSGAIKVPSKRKALGFVLGQLAGDIPTRAANAVARFVLEKVPRIRRTDEPLVANARRENLLMRSFYAINAAERLRSAEDPGEAYEAEKRHFQAHQQASENRLRAAREAEDAVRKYGPVPGWHGILDEKTDPECRERIGTNFDTRAQPWPLPGTVHPHCRCWAGPPFE